MTKFLILILIITSFNLMAIDLSGFKFTDSYRYSYLEDAGLEDFKSIVFTSSIAHIEKPLFITDANSTRYKRSIIDSNNMITLGSSLIHIYPNLKLGVYVNLQRVETANETFFHFGDTFFKARYIFWQMPDASFALNPFIVLPTGKKSSFSTQGSIGTGFRLVTEKKFTDTSILGSIGYAHADKNKYQIINYRNLLLLELGLSIDINDKLNANLEINRNFTLTSDQHQDEGDYYLTFKHKTTSVINSYGGIGIAGLNDLDKKNWTLFAGVKFDIGPDMTRRIEDKPIEPIPTKKIK